MRHRYYPEADNTSRLIEMGRKEESKGIWGVGGNGGYLNPRIPLSNTNIYVKVYIWTD